MLAILQRDSRMIDFLMEDISVYDDEQIGAAVRACRSVRAIPSSAMSPSARHRRRRRHLHQAALERPDPWSSSRQRPRQAGAGGTLRHSGWRAAKVDLPALNPKQDAAVIAPAEIEIE